VSGSHRDRNGRGSAPGSGHGPRQLDDIPLHCLGTPADVVGLVLFLCSPEAAYLTGQAVNVDGGKVTS
jgi:NAD(P)-dependent dehydrogenase (short-subunit alcohol dehydrogenase family)